MIMRAQKVNLQMAKYPDSSPYKYNVPRLPGLSLREVEKCPTNLALKIGTRLGRLLLVA